MDAHGIRRVVDELNSYTPCKTKKQHEWLVHLVSYIYSKSLAHFGAVKAAKVLATILLAGKHHAGEYRETGGKEPYVTHSLEVAYDFMVKGLFDYVLTLASILHDAIENHHILTDRKEASRDIKRILGTERHEVLYIVMSVTKNPKKEDASEEDIEEERRRHHEAIIESKDARIKLLKIGDRKNSMKTFDLLPDKKRKRKVAETREHFFKICEGAIEILSKRVRTRSDKLLLLAAKKIVKELRDGMKKFPLQ